MGLFGNKVGKESPANSGSMPHLSKGQMILGGIADALSSWGGGQPTFMPRLLAQRQAAMDEQRRQQALQDQRDTWLMQQQWERANPKAPSPNDTERDYAFMVQTVGKEAADNWLRRRGDPFIATTLPNGQFYSGPQSEIGQVLGGAAAPVKPVGKLTPLGGAGTSAPRPFP